MLLRFGLHFVFSFVVLEQGERKKKKAKTRRIGWLDFGKERIHER